MIFAQFAFFSHLVETVEDGAVASVQAHRYVSSRNESCPRLQAHMRTGDGFDFLVNFCQHAYSDVQAL